MNEFKGTKSPWTIEFTHAGSKCAYAIKEHNGNAIEDCSNARLIAASPDLLYACQEALKYVCAEEPAHEILTKAIQKALG